MNISAFTRRPVLRITLVALSALAGTPARSQPDTASVTSGLTPEGGHIVVEARGVPAPAPLFFSAAIEQVDQVGAAAITGEMRLRLHVLQGTPDVLTLGLTGSGDVVDVSGPGLAAWSVRRAVGDAVDTRRLDLHVRSLGGAPAPRDYDLLLHSRLLKPAVPGTTAVMIATPGDAVGFSATLDLRADPDVDMRVTSVEGLLPIGERDGATRFYSTGEGRIEAGLTQRGASLSDADLIGAQLSGTLARRRQRRFSPEGAASLEEARGSHPRALRPRGAERPRRRRWVARGALPDGRGRVRLRPCRGARRRRGNRHRVRGGGAGGRRRAVP